MEIKKKISQPLFRALPLLLPRQNEVTRKKNKWISPPLVYCLGKRWGATMPDFGLGLLVPEPKPEGRKCASLFLLKLF